jgi:hypothetical protein
MLPLKRGNSTRWDTTALSVVEVLGSGFRVGHVTYVWATAGYLIRARTVVRNRWDHSAEVTTVAAHHDGPNLSRTQGESRVSFVGRIVIDRSWVWKGRV